MDENLDPGVLKGPDEPRQPTRVELLELEMDTRMPDLWQQAVETKEWNLEMVAAFMRAAYGRGYTDALSEEERGELTKKFGYTTPNPADHSKRIPNN